MKFDLKFGLMHFYFILNKINYFIIKVFFIWNVAVNLA